MSDNPVTFARKALADLAPKLKAVGELQVEMAKYFRRKTWWERFWEKLWKKEDSDSEFVTLVIPTADQWRTIIEKRDIVDRVFKGEEPPAPLDDW